MPRTLTDRCSSRPILVTATASPTWRRPLEWSAEDARRRDVPLVIASVGQPADQPVGEAFAAALGVLRKSRPPVRVRVVRVRPDGSDLLRLSGTAGRLVTSPTGPQAAELVMNAECPVVVVPDREPLPGRQPVVVFIAPWTAEHVVDAAFREAASRRAPLNAIRVRAGRGNAAVGSAARPVDGTAGDGSGRELEVALSSGTGRFPGVDVERFVVRGDPEPEIHRWAELAQLVVLGRSVRGVDLARRVGSPIADVARGARCPTMVVPG